MVTYTGAQSNLYYAYETTFGTAPTINTSSNVFGLNARVSTLSLTTNRIDFNKLGQVEPHAFGYGQQQGSLSVGFVFDTRTSHRIFEGIYAADASNSSPFHYPATLGQGQTSPETKSFTTQVQLQTGGNKITRQLLGCITNSISLSTSIGEPVNGTLDATFGKEVASSTAVSSGDIIAQTGVTGDPLTFAHGTFKVSDGTNLVTIGEIQSVDVTWNQNAELLYQLGSHHAADKFRRVLDITGRFQTTWKDVSLLTHVLNQAVDAAETDGSIDPDSAGNVGASLTFAHAGDSGKTMTIEFEGVSFGEHSVTGLEPVQPVFEELPFKARSAKIASITA